jgi:hypothetical protein
LIVRRVGVTPHNGRAAPVSEHRFMEGEHGMSATRRSRTVMETLRRTIPPALLAIAAAGTVSAAPASPSGTPDKSDDKSFEMAPAGPYCDPGYHCVFISVLGSAQHPYFNSDNDFTNDTFNNNVSSVVNDNVWSASNSSTGGYESHYYYGTGYTGGLVFCVNPGSSVQYTQLTDDGIPGNGVGQRDEVSSLRLRGTTTIRCF